MANTYGIRHESPGDGESRGTRVGTEGDSARPQPPEKPVGRLKSLDAYRGMIMVMLAASGFGIARLADLPPEAKIWQQWDYETWQDVGFHFEHPEWVSVYDGWKVSFWDLIQPAFMFMVGVAMPFSYRRRRMMGQGVLVRTFHALWRAVALVLLGVFLYSQDRPQTNWIFTNVLAQIGLGYFFVYLLLGRRLWFQLLALAGILGGYWYWFYQYEMPVEHAAAVTAEAPHIFDGKFAPWSKNMNAGHDYDVWLLNELPRPEGDEYRFNGGGYLTLNFVPSMATMLLGVLCGQLLLSSRSRMQKLLMLIVFAGACLGLGLAAGEWACPIVKRIWTPSWALFSGGYVIAMLAAFYFVFDILPLGWLAFPLVVVGMNSLVMYLLGQLLRPWTIRQVKIHLDEVVAEHIVGPGAWDPEIYGRIVEPTSAFVVFWLVVFWMYRQKFFVRL